MEVASSASSLCQRISFGQVSVTAGRRKWVIFPRAATLSSTAKVTQFSDGCAFAGERAIRADFVAKVAGEIGEGLCKLWCGPFLSLAPPGAAGVTL
jgi:hypothetical protein